MLYSYGFGEACNINIFLLLFKQWAIDLYLHDWFLNLEKSNIALLYRNITVYFRPSLYLTVISNIQNRSALTQLGTRSHKLSHKLHEGTVNWCKSRPTSFDERLCILCNRDELEDEYHFVL